MIDAVSIAVVVALGWALLAPIARALPRAEGRLVAASFAMHVAASFAVVLVANLVYDNVFDAVGFRRAGQLIADAIRQDPWEVIPRTVGLFFHQDTVINVPLRLETRGGRSTVSMWIVAAYGELFLNSFYGTSVACALFSFSGKLAAFRTLRGHFEPAVRPWVAASMLLVPSVVYWTSGLIKEGIAVGGLGYALAGAHALFVGRRPRGVVPLGFGVAVVLVIKPYLLVPFGIGFAALMAVQAAGRGSLLQIRPTYLVIGSALALAAIVAVGQLFPMFALENIGESAARMQFYGRRAAGGSFYVLGDPNTTSALGQLKFAPIGLFTALYRPTLIEVRNAMMAINAVETTALLGLTVYVVATRGWRWAVRTIASNPALAFAMGFAVPLALGVGLVSNNFGTLSRYRCPLVPYQVMVLTVLYAGARAPRPMSPVPAPAQVQRRSPLPPPGERPPVRRREAGPGRGGGADGRSNVV